jgi:hypothetical protein
VRDQPARRRLQCGRGQATTEIRFMKPRQAQSGRRGIRAQPDKRQFIGYREQRDRVRRGMPVADDIGVRDGELERRVDRLAGLDPGG